MADKYDDKIQHGIDDDPNNDDIKARNLGAAGGAVTGAIAGSAAGPLGTIGGAIIGGVAAGLASQAAVHEVDKHDNDNTLSGFGDDATRDVEDQADDLTHGRVGNDLPGVQTGGRAIDGTPDTRGVTEKVADTVTGDRVDDKTGKIIK